MGIGSAKVYGYPIYLYELTMEFYECFEYIKKDINLFEALDADQQEVANYSKQYGFGSIAWQKAMITRIKRKLSNNEPLTGLDDVFIETMAIHNQRLMDELKACGLERFDLN